MNPSRATAPSSALGAGVRWRNVAAAMLFVFGLTQIVGDLIGSRTLRGIGAVSAVAPFPKVFCDWDGVEGFACEFTLLTQSEDGGIREIPLTAELYQQLAGPTRR